jgi:hypothetical protein
MPNKIPHKGNVKKQGKAIKEKRAEKRANSAAEIFMAKPRKRK